MNEIVEMRKQTPIEIALGIDGNGMTTAKKLFNWLGMDKSNYSRWIKRNITENPFAENGVDYQESVRPTGRTNEKRNPNPTADYKITAEFAKKLSMMEKTKTNGCTDTPTLHTQMSSIKPYSVRTPINSGRTTESGKKKI